MRVRSFLLGAVLAVPLAGGVLTPILPLRAQEARMVDEPPGPLLYYSQAECLRAKADMYRDAVGPGPGLVFVGFCEEDIVKPTPGQISSGSTQNSLQDSVIRFTEKQMRELPGLGALPANMKAVVVVLSWEQIACIRDRFDKVVVARDETTFTRKAASGAVEDKVAELRLHECAR